MPGPTSINEIDLAPLSGKTYFDIDREWREEFIYFLMVDRFQDDGPRTPVLQSQRSKGVHTPSSTAGRAEGLGGTQEPV
jgi:alpha-amylase